VTNSGSSARSQRIPERSAERIGGIESGFQEFEKLQLVVDEQLRCFLVPAHDEDDPADKADAADNRSERHGMFLVFVNLDRTELRHVFFRGVTNVTAIREGDHPDRDQNDPENSGGLHAALERTPACDQIHDQDDQRDHQHEVNQAADVEDGEAEQPQNQKNYKDSPKHMFSFELVYFASFAERPLRLKIFRNGPSFFRPTKFMVM